MGDEKDSWKVKTLDEILQEKKRRKEQEEKAEIKRMKNVSAALRCPGVSDEPAELQGFSKSSFSDEDEASGPARGAPLCSYARAVCELCSRSLTERRCFAKMSLA